MKMQKTKLREAEKIAAAITSSSTHDNNGDDVTEDPSATKDNQQDKSSPSSRIERLEEAYQKALTAFKADKTNKDLRRAKTATRQALDSAITASQPKGSKQLTCVDCSRIFFFSKEDQKKHKKMKWNEMPKRCELCKSKRTERLANQRVKLDTKERNICYAFQAGECPFGASCKFSHNPNHAGGKRSGKSKKEDPPRTTDATVEE